MVLSKLLIIIAKIIIDPPIKTLIGGISFKNNHTHNGAKMVSASINNPIVTDFVVIDPIVIHTKPNVSWGTPSKKPIKISLFEKLKSLVIKNEINVLEIDAYQIAGTKSKLEFFLIIITSIEKLIGIVKATKLPKRVPPEIESPIITEIPIIASVIERRLIIEIFSLK